MKRNNYALYLSGLINEMESVEEMPETETSTDPQLMNQLLNKISTRLGEKANTYRPLVNYLKVKPQMLELFDRLLDHIGEMRPTTFDQINKPFEHE